MKYVVEIKAQDGEMIRVKDPEGNDVTYKKMGPKRLQKKSKS